MRFPPFLLVLVSFELFALGTPASLAQDESEDASVGSVSSPLFSSHEVLDVRIEADLSAVLKDRGDSPEYRPAKIRFTDADGRDAALEVRIRPRGLFRKNRSNCDFPPLRLNFKKKDVRGTLFDGQDKLKLVTHCQTRRGGYEQYVLKEYLVYRTLNEITDLSFRVRLLRVTYVDDTKANDKGITRYGFLIEDADEMAGRNNADVIEQKGMHQHVTSKDETTLMTVFQYMIGNLDWSVPALHNIVLLRPKELSVFLPVPYDFDFSGVVNAQYAIPPPHLGVSSVEERLYRGNCQTEDELQSTLDRFLARKDEILELWTSDLLDSGNRKRAARYMEDFFKNISNPRSVRADLVNTCRSVS